MKRKIYTVVAVLVLCGVCGLIWVQSIHAHRLANLRRRPRTLKNGERKNEELEAVRAKREQLEADKMTRRAALRKMGMTTGFALFGMFAVDDLARMTMTRLKQMHLHNQAINTVAQEFKNVGVAFANPDYTPSSPNYFGNCAYSGCNSYCAVEYYNGLCKHEGNQLQCCEQACNDCCDTSKNTTGGQFPCGTDQQQQDNLIACIAQCQKNVPH